VAAAQGGQIAAWLTYFGNTILEAQRNTIKRVDFHVAKAKFYEKFRGQFNARQDKARVLVGRKYGSA
jgi:hypothetical protein